MLFSDGCIDPTLTLLTDKCVFFQKSVLFDSKGLSDLNLHNSHLYVNVLFKGRLLGEKRCQRESALVFHGACQGKYLL